MEIRVRIALSDGAGHSFGETLVPASLAGFPTSAWQVGDLIQTPFRLDLPASMNAGKYHLRVGLLGPDDLPLPSWVGWPLSGPDTVDFGEADVVDWPLVTELPPGIHPFEAEFGVSIRLRGFELAPNPVRLGSTLALTLTWQAVTRPLASYKVFVHFVDAAGQLVSQVDHIPVNGTRATDGWRPGEVVIDRYEIPVPANLPAGSYRLMIGLYRLEDNTRLPALLAGQRQADDRLDLDQVIQIE
jgi:hypothetical protein